MKFKIAGLALCFAGGGMLTWAWYTHPARFPIALGIIIAGLAISYPSKT